MALGGSADALGRVGGGDTRRRPTSEGGGGHVTPAPGSTWRRAVERYKKSVWAPVASKALAIRGGMLALAAIGASSIASGSKSGVEVPSAAPAASFRAGGVAPFLGQKAAQPPAAGQAHEAAPSAGLTEDG